jgi:peptidoglycan hydrolase-like protein with peptidoglycan-binding domain
LAESKEEPKMHKSMLMTACAAALAVVATGCADMKAPSGNLTDYATGSYRMPPKQAAATQAPVQARANGDATAADSRTRSNAPVNTSELTAAQHALARAGYAPGNATGSMDASTHDALMQFQRAHGLRATGDLDSATKSALGLPAQ